MHTDGVTAIAFSPDGKLLASGGYRASEDDGKDPDETVRLWDPTTGFFQGTLAGLTNSIQELVFSPDGKLLTSSDSDIRFHDSDFRLWDLTTRASLEAFDNYFININGIAFSPDGKILACRDSEKYTIRLWDSTLGTSRGTFHGHSDNVRVVAFSRDGRLLASGSSDSTVRLWDSITAALQKTLKTLKSDRFTEYLAFSPDGTLLAHDSTGHGEKVCIWDLTTGALLETLIVKREPYYYTDIITALAFSFDGKLLTAAIQDSIVILWAPTTGVLQVTLEGYSSELNTKFSPDGKLLASLYRRNTVKLRDPTTGVLQGILEGPTFRYIHAVEFSPDSKLLASASDDMTVRLWDISTKECLRVFHADFLNWELWFSKSGQFLYTPEKIIELDTVTKPSSSHLAFHSPAPFSVIQDWVYLGKQRILWLPAEYRPDGLNRFDIYGNLLGLGLPSGEVIFIGFNPEKVPLGTYSHRT
jgi:WD40 repeat protein